MDYKKSSAEKPPQTIRYFGPASAKKQLVPLKNYPLIKLDLRDHKTRQGRHFTVLETPEDTVPPFPSPHFSSIFPIFPKNKSHAQLTDKTKWTAKLNHHLTQSDYNNYQLSYFLQNGNQEFCT